MKMNRIKSRAFNFYLNPFGLAATLALGFYTLPVMAADNMEAPVAQPANTETSRMGTSAETFSDTWQSPVIIEFNKLDTSGNGLLLPGEASKGKAFNKKTFAQTDADHDGTIDQDEYVFFKTGKMPETTMRSSIVPPANAPTQVVMPDVAKPAAQDMKSDIPMPQKAMPDMPMIEDGPK